MLTLTDIAIAIAIAIVDLVFKHAINSTHSVLKRTKQNR